MVGGQCCRPDCTGKASLPFRWHSWKLHPICPDHEARQWPSQWIVKNLLVPFTRLLLYYSHSLLEWEDSLLEWEDLVTTTIDLQGKSNFLSLEVPWGISSLCVCSSLPPQHWFYFNILQQNPLCPARDLPNKMTKLLSLPLESLDLEGSKFSALLSEKLNFLKQLNLLAKRLCYQREFRSATHTEQRNSFLSPPSSLVDQLHFDTMWEFQD